jgi:hypothetical protein
MAATTEDTSALLARIALLEAAVGDLANSLHGVAGPNSIRGSHPALARLLDIRNDQRTT